MDVENQPKSEGFDVVEEIDFSTARNSMDLEQELIESKEKEATTFADNNDEKEKNIENDFSLEEKLEENYEKKSPIVGELDEDTVYENISCIQKSNHGSLQNLTFSGSNLKLVDISILEKYSLLQSVDVSNNNISDLSALGSLNCLLILNASNNKITKLLDFKPPKNLKCANFSNNLIEEIPDLSAHHYLSELYLDYNKIRQIQGISRCHRLSKLSLSYNQISKIKNIDSLPLVYLNVSNNHVYKIDNLESLQWLREIYLSHNLMHSLNGLQKHHLLETINVNNNQIQYIEEILYIRDLSMLRRFMILQNPICKMFNYQLAILFQIQQLLELNGTPVSIKSKVEARNLFSPCLEVVAAKNHMLLTYYAFSKPCSIKEVTMLNISESYPLLILVGNEECGNKMLAMKLAEEFSENLGYGIFDTTRPMLPEEVDGKDFNFYSQNHFHQDVLNGEFIVTCQFKEHYYGLKSRTLEHIANEGKGCITHMQLEAMLTLKNSHFRPRFILTVHSSREKQKTYMKSTGLYTNNEIENALQRWDAFVDYNQRHPGAFFIVVITDDLESAHQKLHQLIKSWIGSSDKLPRLSPIGNQHEKEFCCTPCTTNVVDQPLYLAPMVGIVEEESLKRRYQAVKKVVQAYVPPLFDQITRFNTSDTMNINLSDHHLQNRLSRSLSDDFDDILPTSASNTAKLFQSENKSSPIEEQLQSSETDVTKSEDKTFEMDPTPPSEPRPMYHSTCKRHTRIGSANRIVIPPIAATDSEK